MSIARVAGETAPLLFTAFGNPFMNLNLLKPVNSLPLLVFNYAASPYPEWHALAWGASLVLVVFVLLLNVVCKGDDQKMESPVLKTENFCAYFGDNQILKEYLAGNYPE